ncbi:cupin domain-containing protein [Kitasatospora sp. LaBMicrA B282]|uniref:cupin domain-containing protein n=1 Tax=Kitasatospora sp. LaBMicrA B282 TaxID=3420949 RepID=UPI003D117563
MPRIDLPATAAALPLAWHSRVLGEVADACVKVLRMDGRAVPEEVHEAAEVLVVLEGHLELEVAGEPVRVVAGELYRVPAGVRHAVRPGSRGTLVIVERAVPVGQGEGKQ